MAAFLVPLDPGACLIPLEKAVILIGRQSDCDVALTISRKISRKHCCIAIVNNSVVVRDLGSTNGCSVNGQRVEREVQLKMGDELSIGDVRFRLQPTVSSTRSQPAPAREIIKPSAPPPSPVHRMAEDEAAVSMEFPVALIDEGHDFAVEPSVMVPRVKAPARLDSGPLIPLAPVDLADDDEDGLPLQADRH